MKRAIAVAGLVLLLGLTGCTQNHEAQECIKSGGSPVWVKVKDGALRDPDVYLVQCHAKEEK